MPLKKFKKLPAKKKTNFISQKITNILKILTIIDSGERVTTPNLSADLGVAEKTIYRYIKTIQSAGIPLSYDSAKKSYVFSDDFSLKKIPHKPEELSALITLKDIVSKLGIPAEFQILKTIDKILGPSINQDKSRKFPIFIETGRRAESPEMEKKLSIIEQAISKRRMVNLTYKAFGKDNLSNRDVGPYGTLYSDGFWYLIGKCYQKHDIRTFAVDKIRDINLTEKPYGIPPDFTLEKYLEPGFKMVVEKGTQEVVIKFSSRVAEHILRKKWHPTQKEERLLNGDVILRFKVAGTREIKQWANSWMPNCEVLEPHELREEVKEELLQALKSYR